MPSSPRDLAKEFDGKPYPVFSFYAGHIVYMNPACREFTDGLDLSGYGVEHIIGEDLISAADLSLASGTSVHLTNFALGDERGRLDVYPGPATTVVFRSGGNTREKALMDELSTYGEQLDRDIGLMLEQCFGIGERVENYARLKESALLTGLDLTILRLFRRRTQITMLSDCLRREPARDVTSGDIGEFCRRFFDESRGIMASSGVRGLSMADKGFLRSTAFFSEREVERLLACLLTGALAMSGGEPLRFSLSSLGGTVRIRAASDSPLFNKDSFSQALELPESLGKFIAVGSGLELRLASELAARSSGYLRFMREDGHGVLTAVISPENAGYTPRLAQETLASDTAFPQLVVEYSELIS